MTIKQVMRVVFVGVGLTLSVLAGGQVAGAQVTLPAAEDAIKNTVDHWGLPFSDQFRVFQKRMAEYGKTHDIGSPAYALGVETSLRKTFGNKYWFKGKWTTEVSLSAGRGEAEAFQLAVLPNVGQSLEGVRVTPNVFTQVDGDATLPAEAISIWRVGYVTTTQPQYPVRHVGDWPDPLISLSDDDGFAINGTDLGLLWYEVKVPRDAPAGRYRATLKVETAGLPTQEMTINLHVWAFTLPERIPRPTLVWIPEPIDTDHFYAVCDLFLDHHVDPISVHQTWDMAQVERYIRYMRDRGAAYYQLLRHSPKRAEDFDRYYKMLRERGWLDRAFFFGADEPTRQQLEQQVTPRIKSLRKNYPELNVLVASEYHPGIDRAADMWMTDLSTHFHDWLEAGRPGNQQLWFYFCHAPVRAGMDRPLFDAPNMLTDNDAIEHRVLNWMTYHYQAKGIFIWAGNWTWPKGYDGNADQPFDLKEKSATFPHGGVHNGNGYLIYPGPRPSIRLKVLRDGIEDYWYLTELKRLADEGDKQATALLDGMTPAVFVDTHYFARNPHRLLNYRQKIGTYLDQVVRSGSR